jgi:hypothetical protein
VGRDGARLVRPLEEARRAALVLQADAAGEHVARLLLKKLEERFPLVRVPFRDVRSAGVRTSPFLLNALMSCAAVMCAEQSLVVLMSHIAQSQLFSDVSRGEPGPSF